MKFRNEKINSLFSPEKISFIIPDYKRAYSWKKEQYEQFFSDLEEQSKSENNYFFGNILVEKSEDSSQLEIVDGQQRITTIIIFIRSLINVCLERIKYEKTKINLPILEKTYIGSSDNPKLIPCKIDRNYFDTYIINNNKAQIKSKSQENIKNANNYFTRKLKSIKSVSKLSKILNKLQESAVTITVIERKTDSAFMFELQNNRGKDITEMEQVKAYLMYQIYINDKKNLVDNRIEDISELFGKIYLSINDIKNITEDD